jgi:hypothetical protein
MLEGMLGGMLEGMLEARNLIAFGNKITRKYHGK